LFSANPAIEKTRTVRSRIVFVAALAASVINGLPAVAGSNYPAHTPVSEVTRPPIGWVEFCVEYYPECKTKPSVPRDILVTTRAWKELLTEAEVGAS
jgi:predicted transglutaminase-like cysteine proteinase